MDIFTKKSLIPLLSSLTLFACGGGGESPTQIPTIIPEIKPTAAIIAEVKPTVAITPEVLPTAPIKIANEAPIFNDQSISVNFNQAVTFSLGAIDTDNDLLNYTVLEQATLGALTLNATTETLTYTPSNDQVGSDHFIIQVSDGEVSTDAHFDITITDLSAPIVQSLSENKTFSPNAPIQLSFDDLIDKSTITVNSADNSCSGSIQLSKDDFVTCVVLQKAPTAIRTAVDDDYIKSITLVTTALQSNTRYQIRLNELIQNYHGLSLENTQFDYQTASTLPVINEISSSDYLNSRRWLEIYNGTENAIDLANYNIVSQAIDATGNIAPTHTFSLPVQMLESGHYVIIQAQEAPGSWQNDAQNSAQLVVIDDTQYAPYWDESGYIELVNSNDQSSIDFVRFGTNTQPINSTVTSRKTYSSVALTGKSLARDINHNDTESSTDWTVTQFATPAGVNDVNNCISDDDADGIPDCAELKGSQFSGLPLYEWGARTDQKDIFIEVDYMQSSDLGITPQKEALQKVKESFAKKGYSVHFDTGALYHQEAGISHDDFDLSGGNQVPFAQTINFLKERGISSIVDYKSQHMDLRRRQVFFYMLFASSQEISGLAGSSGLAEVNGNDSIISLGQWGLNKNSVENNNALINIQAGTMMHEFGHNLGLLHGGDDDINFKPNYLSIMNYLYQLEGLATPGNNEGDRYYQHRFAGDHRCAQQLMINNVRGPVEQFVIDYSNGSGAMINENNIDESKGLGRPLTSGIDFNCNGTIENKIGVLDINGSDWVFENNNWSEKAVIADMHDHNDWEKVSLKFQDYWSGNAGQSRSAKSVQEKVDFMLNDKQQIIVEKAPSDAFFKRLRGE